MRNPQRLIENRTAVQKIIASMKWGWPASLLPVRCFGWFEGKFAGIPVEWFLNCGHYVSVTEEFWSWETSRAIGTALTYHALVYFIIYYLHTFWAHVNSCILWWNIHGFGKEKRCLCVFHHAFSSSVAVDFILLYLGLFFLLASKGCFSTSFAVSSCAILIPCCSPHFLLSSIFKIGLDSSFLPLGSTCHHCHLHQIFSWESSSLRPSHFCLTILPCLSLIPTSTLVFCTPSAATFLHALLFICNVAMFQFYSININ